MNAYDHFLFPLAAILTIGTGIFLPRESAGKNAESGKIESLKSRIFDVLAFLGSLLTIGWIGSLLYSKAGISSGITLLLLFSFAVTYGHQLNQPQSARQFFIKFTAGIWTVWVANWSQLTSGFDTFLLMALSVWLTTSLFVRWNQSSSKYSNVVRHFRTHH